MAPTSTASKTKTTTFFTPLRGLRLVRAAELTRTSATGLQEKLSPGLTYEFGQEGYLEVDERLRKQTREFFRKYGDSDDELQDDCSPEEWLRKHHLFAHERGFVEVQEQIPDSAPALLEVTNALVDGDESRLVEMYEAEEAGHRRPDVLEAVSRSLKSLEAPAEGG